MTIARRFKLWNLRSIHSDSTSMILKDDFGFNKKVCISKYWNPFESFRSNCTRIQRTIFSLKKLRLTSSFNRKICISKYRNFLENWNFSFHLYENLKEDIWFEKIVVEKSVSPNIKTFSKIQYFKFFLIARKLGEPFLIWKKKTANRV